MKQELKTNRPAAFVHRVCFRSFEWQSLNLDGNLQTVDFTNTNVISSLQFEINKILFKLDSTSEVKYYSI